MRNKSRAGSPPHLDPPLGGVKETVSARLLIALPVFRVSALRDGRWPMADLPGFFGHRSSVIGHPGAIDRNHPKPRKSAFYYGESPGLVRFLLVLRLVLGGPGLVSLGFRLVLGGLFFLLLFLGFLLGLFL